MVLSGSFVAFLVDVLERPSFVRLVTIIDTRLILPGSNTLDSRISGILDLLICENHPHCLRRLALRMKILYHVTSLPNAFPSLRLLQYVELRIRYGGSGALPPDLEMTFAALTAAAPRIHTVTFTFITFEHQYPGAAAGAVALVAILNEDGRNDEFRGFVAGMEAGLPAMQGARLLDFDFASDGMFSLSVMLVSSLFLLNSRAASCLLTLP
ncbi:hypothetical protein C8R44DRAFT_893367 [Mycena epipterygia]|nr:hypothetical protein C8R44DRAFT_893367 [Mycena epipterygia]